MKVLLTTVACAALAASGALLYYGYPVVTAFSNAHGTSFERSYDPFLPAKFNRLDAATIYPEGNGYTGAIDIGFDGYAIGGLSVGEPRRLTQEMIAEVLPLLPADKPRYLMGVGYPDEIEQYARMGVDMMDCVLPTRAARHGRRRVAFDQRRRAVAPKEEPRHPAHADPADSLPLRAIP